MHTGDMLQTDWNGRALCQTTQGISLGVQSAPKTLISKCTSHACTVISNQVRLLFSKQECVQLGREQLRGLRRRPFGCNSSRREQWSPKIDRHDKSWELTLWLVSDASTSSKMVSFVNCMSPRIRDTKCKVLFFWML